MRVKGAPYKTKRKQIQETNQRKWVWFRKPPSLRRQKYLGKLRMCYTLPYILTFGWYNMGDTWVKQITQKSY